MYESADMDEPGVYMFGPVGRYPWKYRVIISDKVDDEDVDADWYVRLQKRRLSDINDWKTVYGQKLYPYGKSFTDRTKAAGD